METKQYILAHQQKFENLIAKHQDYNEIMFAYLRATNETLLEGHFGAEAPAQPKKPRKPRGPNKKKADVANDDNKPHGDQVV